MGFVSSGSFAGQGDPGQADESISVAITKKVKTSTEEAPIIHYSLTTTESQITIINAHKFI